MRFDLEDESRVNIALLRAGVPARRLRLTAALHVLSLGGNAVCHGLGIHCPFPTVTWLTIFFNIDREDKTSGSSTGAPTERAWSG